MLRLLDGANDALPRPFRGPMRFGLQPASDTAPPHVYDPDAAALFDRFDIEPTTARKALINERFIAGKGTTWWAKLDALWVHAAHGPEAGRLNWLAPRFNCKPVNNPTFVVDRGYASDGVASYLDTQFNPAVEAPLGSKYQQDSASFGVRSNTNDSGSASIAGHWDGSKGTTILPRSGDRAGFRVNTSTYTQTSAGVATTGMGMFVATRTSATVSRYLREGTLLTSSTAASTALVNLPLLLGGITASSLRPAEFSMGFIGAGLTDAEVLSIAEWFRPYKDALGID